MSVRVSIFNKRAYREFTLTSYLSHADKRLLIDADLFWIEENVELLLETAEGKWVIRQDESYKLFSGDLSAPCQQDILLCDGQILAIETVEGERLNVYISVSEESIVPFAKYEILKGAMSFAIGNHPDRDILYCPGETFLQAFAKDEGCNWVIVSYSAGEVLVKLLMDDGVYINGGKVTGQAPLNPGDILQVYGLSLCLLKHQRQTVFAIYCSYGEYKVNPLVLTRFKGVLRVNDLVGLGNSAESNFFRRSPRQLEPLATGKISIEEPPSLDQSAPPSFFQAVGSSLLMVMPMVAGCAIMLVASRQAGYQSSLFMYSGLVMALTSAIVGVIWGIANARAQKKQRINAEHQRFLAYSQYLVAKKEEIEEKYEGNIASMLRMYPDISELAAYNRKTPGLWNRNEKHEDFLQIRIGLGDTPFQVEIEIPREKFHLYDDELREKPEYIKKNFETLYDVPQLLSFKEHHVIGVVGGEEKYGAYEIARLMVMRLAATHSPTDVKMVFIYDENSVTDRKQWDFVRFLPHVWSENHKMRYVAANPAEISEVCYSLAGVFRKRLEEAEKQVDKSCELPYYVIFLSDASLVEGELIANNIFNNGSQLGVSTVILSEVYEDLPNGCNCVLENTESFAGINNQSLGGFSKSISFDQVSLIDCESFARNITNIHVKSVNATGEIPDSISFLDMYQVDTVEELGVEERWFKNKVFENIRGMVGVKGEGAPVYLDVHEKYHGPHGLVAGTTGSGKSETLQTYLLSLAVNYSPDDISYFIIDYKGGGMANLFDELPHLAGSISNLSGTQINRALVSIKSENRRRQRLFNEADVNNINSYTKLYKSGKVKETLPHLFIIIDEFAELKREEPDFMKELISVAQVGRSLGVHLILSTQKPSGTVDDNIWSNSRFKLCLRVQTKEDSMEMLGKPDAAYINQAGRCYLEVGSEEIYELFQSGYSGAVYDPLSAGKRISTSIVNNNGQEEVTLTFAASGETGKINQLDAVTQYIKEEAKRLEISSAHRLWMPMLKNPLYLMDLEAYRINVIDYDRNQFTKHAIKENGEWNISAVIGQTDDPGNQAQEPLVFTLSDGHIGIIGSTMSGKSTMVNTIIYSLATTYSSEVLNFYCLDYSSKMLLSLKALPHVGGVFVDGEEEKVARLFNMLLEMLEERKKLFSGGNYAQYVRAKGVEVPAIIVIIDNFASFNERTQEKYMPDLIRIGKEGVANGIFMLLTGAAYNMNEIPTRLSATIGKSYCLALADKFAYGDVLHNLHVDVVPDTSYKGRGITYVGQNILEYQVCLPLEAQDDYLRLERIRKTAENISDLWKGRRAKQVPEIPDKPMWENFKENEDVIQALTSDNLLPIGYKSTNAGIYSLDIYDDYCYLITGVPHTGKKSLLRLMLYGAMEKQDAVITVIDSANTFLDLADERTKYVASEEELYEYCLNDLTPLFKERNARKKALLADDLEGQEYYDRMRDLPPVYIFITSMSWFIGAVYSDERNMSGFMETLFKKGEGHKISFIGIMDLTERAKVAGYEAFNAFGGYGRGIQLGGNCMQNPYLSFGYMTNIEQAQNLPAGIGILSEPVVPKDKAKIMIPLAKKQKKPSKSEVTL